MTILSENLAAGGFIASEANGSISRERILVGSNQTLKAGAVLARTLTINATSAGTNTGNGAPSASAVIGPNTVPGEYKAVCVAAATNAGTFNLYAPDGTLVRTVTAGGGAHASSHITVTIADGSTDFAVGDTITFAVAASNSWYALNPAATDGKQIATGVLYGPMTTTGGAAYGVGVVRNAELNDEELTWPTVTQSEKNAAVAQLAKLGIVLRNLQAVVSE